MTELRKITKSTITYFFGNVSSKLVAFLMLKVYTTFILPEDFGTYDMMTTYATMISSIVFLDIWSGIMRFMFDYHDGKEKDCVIKSGLYIFFTSTVIYLLAFYVFSLFVSIEYPSLAFLYGFALCIQNLYGYVARGVGLNLKYAVSGIVATFVNAILNVFFIVILRWDYSALYTSFFWGILVQVLLLEGNIKIINIIRYSQYNKNITREMLKFSLPLAINSASYWMLSSYSKIIVNSRLGAEYNGYNAVAAKISVVITLVTMAFNMSWQELTFSKADINDENGRFYTKALRSYIWLLFVGTIILIPMINIIFDFIIGEKYISAKLLIPVYIIATVVSVLSTFLGNILTAYKKTSTIFISTSIAAVINIVILHTFIDKYGLMIVPLAMLIGYSLSSIIRILLIKRTLVLKVYLYDFLFFIPILYIIVQIYHKLPKNMNFMTIVIIVAISIYKLRNIFDKIRR